MPELWRLTRNRYGRLLYDSLTAAGLTATWLTEYRADPAAVAADAGERRVDTRAVAPSTVAPLDAPVADLGPDETVLAAFADGDPVGYLFHSVDATRHIEPLERDLSFDGGYLRRVFVAPTHRQQGVASALLERACQHACDRGASQVTALVARDNVPSRRLFESHRFEPTRARRYLRVGPFSCRSVRQR